MHTVNLTTAKAQLCELVRCAESGEEIVITRHGRPVARMVAVTPVKQPLPLKRLAEFRRKLPAWSEGSAEILRKLRDAAR
ncbi:MAG: hypothetical protein A3H31_02585 [Gallionellales bacterium RIFCSPLOWO2_02_FULL_57_47]|nr:MAG: hypothetical protein A3H31_02585 [Gallionellales bacterium RIFCSPLOWO2_02_FULL_57_47]